jgi:predicted acetyltransferase
MQTQVMSQVELIEAGLPDKAVLRNLLELYLHDFSEFDGGDVDAHGLYGYRYLDHYWTEPDRRPFLVLVDGRYAGFALLRVGDPHDVAEFFVLRKYRRCGVGTAVARDLFARFPGRWQVRQMTTNPSATTFWRHIIPVPFEEELGYHELVQRFTIEG